MSDDRPQPDDHPDREPRHQPEEAPEDVGLVARSSATGPVVSQEGDYDRSSTVEVFRDLRAPLPVAADPPPAIRWLAFLATVVGGLLGALVGFGIGDVMAPDSIWAAVGALAGALTGAVGVGILANLTLRAMNEWTTAAHPEAEGDAEPGGRGRRSGRRADRQWTRRPSA